MSNLKNNYLTDAINIKSYNLSESDKIILMYSRDKGLIRGVAKGVKKPKSKLGARMDLLVANKLMLNKGKTLDTICQAEALNTFYNLRSDMDKLFYAMYTSEIVSNFGIENDPNSAEIYKLVKSGGYDDMLTFNMSLNDLCKRKLITQDVALENSDSKNELQQMLRGVYTGTGKMEYS